ncbi:MAG: stage V sporulation protein AD, partial [Clostridiales bacterium]|nr:stage V sporulation protein AD [Clostridiales bacterium]
PAAVDTLVKYFDLTNTNPSDYDLILSGDLGREGHGIVCEFMSAKGYDMGKNYNDCGLLIYNCSEQDVHSGGSGCGCSATVFSSRIMKLLSENKLKNILFMATGALMSAGSMKQGCSIPAIAHLVHVTGGE